MAQSQLIEGVGGTARKAAPGVTAGGVAATLRLEGAAALAASVVGYSALGGNWWVFAALFLVPDLSMLGYLFNRRAGAFVYNLGHSYLTPAALALAGYLANAPNLYPIALIWTAHIGFDRLLGYGLKYAAGFGVTHLGLSGKAAR
jgi:Domain of unknown function (DUF4260)